MRMLYKCVVDKGGEFQKRSFTVVSKIKAQVLCLKKFSKTIILNYIHNLQFMCDIGKKT